MCEFSRLPPFLLSAYLKWVSTPWQPSPPAAFLGAPDCRGLPWSSAKDLRLGPTLCQRTHLPCLSQVSSPLSPPTLMEGKLSRSSALSPLPDFPPNSIASRSAQVVNTS